MHPTPKIDREALVCDDGTTTGWDVVSRLLFAEPSGTTVGEDLGVARLGGDSSFEYDIAPKPANGRASAAPRQSLSGSKRSNELSGEASRFYAIESGDLAALVAQAKHEGLIDPALDTDAVVLFFQALDLGAH